jgi:hypothetical protein
MASITILNRPLACDERSTNPEQSIDILDAVEQKPFLVASEQSSVDDV